jgi:AraC-like DNA-binding protein
LSSASVDGDDSRRGVEAGRRLNSHSGRLSEDLRRVLRIELLKGPCTTREIARLLSIHPRTLSRHLAQEGVSFQQIADEIRFAIACDLLANTVLALNQVSVMLKFSEPSAFTRAFRHWSGQSPSTWRVSHRRSPRLPRRQTMVRSAERPPRKAKPE